MKAIIESEAQKLLVEKHGKSIIMKNYVRMKYLANFQCSICSYEWISVAFDVIRSGTDCYQCGLKRISEKYRHNINFIKDYIKSIDCEWIDGEYKNTGSRLKIRFNCGHEDYKTIDALRAGNRCYLCGRINSANKQKLKEQDIISEVEKHDFHFIKFENGYKNFHSLITYECKFNHITTRRYSIFRRNYACKICKNLERIEKSKKEGNHNWRGGRTTISSFLRKFTDQWYILSLSLNDFKCVITGLKPRVVHHLYPFSKIVDEVLLSLNLSYKNSSKYTEEELISISNKFLELQSKYPLGVPLTYKLHRLFHTYYGKENFTPEDFLEFKSRIQSGEIIISQ